MIRPVAAVVAALLLIPAFAPPGLEPWGPDGISTDQFESHAAFDPRTGDLYFVRSRPDFTGWRILMSHCTRAGWSPPAPPPFAGDGQEADPWFTPDGRTLYFISNRSSDGVARQDLDLWRVSRDANGAWGQPARLSSDVNSTAYEWFPRLSADGWLYYGSGRPGGQGKTDIWRAREDASGVWRVENLGPNVNGPKGEFEAIPSPDGESLIVQSDDGYFETQKTVGGGWSPRRRLGPVINENGSEIGLAASPSGRTLMFARDTHAPKSGEFFVWRRGGAEAWPPVCPRH